ncbi:transcriptional regulator, TetR family [Promicromonospora umidemergens]|uniref:TetR/AcrR family transcriptional regulator n=1 Tax=Promicromonospora umidemergens TaxID=629679 RepID=A0ABP8WYM4_9MICO|nr:TetR/AcrR family transcriptional regulator [Promicromonospora umidemergens]MCP2285709.1 transcriptional regulator, TetR family [Promicromonospora umidemergens]
MTSDPAGRKGTARASQADRRARSRTALLEAAAQGLSRYGYGNLALEQVAHDAGYTRGALYHQFRNKQELSLAVIDWVMAAWQDEVGVLVDAETDPVAALLTLARGHARFCRRDVARMAVALRLEFAGQDHPVGRHIEQAYDTITRHATALVRAARDAGPVPHGPPDQVVGLALIGALEGTVIALAGHPEHDELLAARAVAGVLGLSADTIDGS